METNGQMVSSPAPATRALAHVRRNEDGSFAIHDLEGQLRAVVRMAQCAMVKRDPVTAARANVVSLPKPA